MVELRRGPCHLLFREYSNNFCSAHVWYDLKILKGDTVPGKRDREFDLVSVVFLTGSLLVLLTTFIEEMCSELLIRDTFKI